MKLKNPKDNLWFALSVEQKYQRCFQRYQRVNEKPSHVTMQSSHVLRNVVARSTPLRSTPPIGASKTPSARPKPAVGITGNPTPKTDRRETSGTAREATNLTREEVARKIKQRLRQEGFMEVAVQGRGLVIALRGEVHSHREWRRVFAIAKEEVTAGKYTLDQQVDVVKYQ